MKPTISAIIPTHNGGEQLQQSLISITQTTPPPDEVIVVVDGSSIGIRQLAVAYGVHVLTLPARRGPARARNVGAHVARGDVLFFVDSDVVVPTDAIGQIVAVFEREPELVALIGSYDDEPAASNFLSQYKNLLHHYVHQTGVETASTFWGACGAVRRDVFLDRGGFDERYTEPCIEDIELGYRLTADGHPIKLCKSLQVKHLKRWDPSSLLKTDFWKRALPWTDLILRHRRLVNDLNLTISSRLSTVSIYGLLASLTAVGWWPGFLGLVGIFAFVLLWLNIDLYRFFQQKRGFWFAIQTIPWHWFYYFYSGLAFAIGIINFWSQRLKMPHFLLSKLRQADV